MDIFEALCEKTGAAHAVGFAVGAYANALYLARRQMQFKYTDFIIMGQFKINREALNIAKWLGTELEGEAMDLLRANVESIYLAGYGPYLSEKTIHGLVANECQIIRDWLIELDE